MNRRHIVVALPRNFMYKAILILVIGVAIGYSYGWKDAQLNSKAIYERVVDRVGGTNRDLVSNDIDARVARTEAR